MLEKEKWEKGETSRGRRALVRELLKVSISGKRRKLETDLRGG